MVHLLSDGSFLGTGSSIYMGLRMEIWLGDDYSRSYMYIESTLTALNLVLYVFGWLCG